MDSGSPSTVARLWQQFHEHPVKAIHDWQNYRLTWLIMLGIATFLELCALGFQYILMLQPCELCVYQRLAVIFLMAAPVIMMILPGNIVVRIMGYATWLYGAWYGLSKALIQTGNYADFDPLSSSCSFRPTFPLDLPFYEWLPSVFMPTGICGEDSWTLLGMNMAQWMAFIFSVFLLAAVACIISSAYCWLKKTK